MTKDKQRYSLRPHTRHVCVHTCLHGGTGVHSCVSLEENTELRTTYFQHKLYFHSITNIKIM